MTSRAAVSSAPALMSVHNVGILSVVALLQSGALLNDRLLDDGAIWRLLAVVCRMCMLSATVLEGRRRHRPLSAVGAATATTATHTHIHAHTHIHIYTHAHTHASLVCDTASR